jgi:hypothetical protein
MPFNPLASLLLTEDWQTTPPTAANFFRFKYDANQGFSYLVVAQAQVSLDGSLELFGTFRFALKGQGSDVAELDIPRVFEPEQRRIAVRGLGSRAQSGKSLSLSIEDTHMISNPSGATSKEIFKELQQADALSRELSPANPNRNGGLVFNKGSKALWIGFGIAAEKASPNKVVPGGLMDIPNGFTGPINIIFDAADANLNMKAVSQEMVA